MKPGRRTLVAAAIAIAVAFGSGGLAIAQSIVTAASLSGRVEDPSGAVVSATRITVTRIDTGQSWTAESGDDGRYHLLALPPGDYRIDAKHDGFEPLTLAATLTAGRPLDVPVRLRLQNVTESVSVQADVRAVDMARTQTAETVSPAEIDRLPINGRNYLDLALLTPGASRTNTRSTERFAETSAVPGTGLSINGQRNLSNTFLVDGLSANDDAAGLSGTYLSAEVIREFQIVRAGGVAEFGRAASGAISVVTRSGTDRWSGSVYGYGRNDKLDARNPLATTKDPLHQAQYGVTLGGPLPLDRTFVFANVEQTRQDRVAYVTIAPPAVTAINDVLDRVGFGGPRVTTGPFDTGFDTSNLFAKADRQTPGGSLLSIRYGYYSLSSANARNAGGLNAVSRGTDLSTRDHSIAAGLTTAFSSSLLHETRVQVMRSRLAAPVNDQSGPAVNISGVASFGTSTASPTARDAGVFQVADNLSWQHGSHLSKAGVDALWNRMTIAFPGAVQGVYTFSSLAAFESGRYINFQQAFGEPSVFQSNPNLGVFAQDEWQARDGVTVNAGVRYDVQWLPQPVHTDTGNVAPRLGISWAPGRRRTVVRGSYGIFYDRIPLRATSNALQRDGIHYQLSVLSFGQAGAPPFPGVLAAFPADMLTSVTTIDPGVAHARTAQAGAQVEREVARGVVLSATFTHLDGRNILMSRNANAPTLTAAQAAALGVPNLGRPDSRYANVSRYEGIGESRYDGLTASVNLRSGKWGQVRASYTLSRALDDSGNFFFSAPQDNENVRADWGYSDNDQRHRLVVSGSQATPPAGDGSFLRRALANWQVSYIFGYASALPYNVQTGTDGNSDTNVNDRPAGVPRNSARGFDSATLDVRVGRRFAAAGGRLRIDVIADAFNVLNRANLQIPNNIYGPGVSPLPAFGRPTAAGDPRQLQLGLRLAY